MSVLALKDVSYQYEGTKNFIFKDLSMEFEAGQVYTIVGKSGSGKTTLLSLLSGLDVATTGHIEYQGQSLAEINRNQFRAKNAGIVFQSLNLLTNTTAIDNIVLSMNISGVKGVDKKAHALKLLKMVGISPEKAQRKILKLSGGEQQRIGIARALSHNPDLIIADEPTGNLDKGSEERVLKVLKSLAHNEGKCVIIVTHSRKVATVADAIWRVEKGIFKQISVNKKK